MSRGFPGRGTDSQPTVLVSSGDEGLVRLLPAGLVAGRAAPGDGVVVVTDRDDHSALGRRLSGEDAVDGARVALVDCSGRAPGRGRWPSDLRWTVRDPGSRSRVGAALREALGAVRQQGVRRLHVVHEALTAQFRQGAPDGAVEHARDLALALGGEQGLAVFSVEESAVSAQTFDRLTHLVDVHLVGRRDDRGPQVRWTGLVGDSGGWVDLAESGVPLDGARPG